MAALSCMLLVILIAFLMLRNGSRRSTRITLPEQSSAANDADGQEVSMDTLRTVTVTPETVQAAVATLSRPDSYRRTLTVERFWAEGSGSVTVEQCAANGWTRTDTPAANGELRHSLTDGVTTYIWYGDSTRYYTASAGQISADDEQSIPSYEDLLSLPVEEILTADYRTLSGINCIYVETTSEVRYWIAVDTGLLAAAESGSAWRVSGLELSDNAPATEDFTLPDGTILTEVDNS